MPSFTAEWTIVTASCLVFPKDFKKITSFRTLLPEFEQEPQELSTLLSVLKSLHWLPTYRLDFKVMLPVYKSLDNFRSKYASHLLEENQPRRALRSLGSSQNIVPHNINMISNVPQV